MCLYISLFYKQEMELSLVGLQNAGKTSLVNAIAVSERNLCFYYYFNFNFSGNEEKSLLILLLLVSGFLLT